MYKVFFNERSISLSSDSNLDDWVNYDFIHVFRDRSGLNRVLEIFQNSQIQDLLIISENLDVLKDMFFSYFKVIYAAGGVVKNPKDEYLFIFRRGKWDLPKGKVEKGEEISVTAKREVQEETGIHNLEQGDWITKTYHVYTIGSESVLKETHWYYFKHPGEEEFKPQHEEDIEEAIWANPTMIDFYLSNSYPNIHLVFEAFKRMF